MVEEKVELKRGAIVYDTVEGIVAEVMEVGDRVALRRLGGGTEWWRSKDHLRPPTASERLSPGVAAANARSRGEL
jgi:hypothetical protein